MDFDETRLYYSHQQLQRQPENQEEAEPDPEEDEDAVDLGAVRRHFREFLRKWTLPAGSNTDYML